MPGTAADDQAQKDQQAAALRKRLRQIDTAENAQAREIETLAHLDDPHAPALTALRSRILARFTELEDERTQINTQLADLDKTQPQAGDPALLDALPLLQDMPAGASPKFHQDLYHALDLQARYDSNAHQVSLSVTITDNTPRAIAAIITASNPPADIFSDLAQPPMPGGNLPRSCSPRVSLPEHELAGPVAARTRRDTLERIACTGAVESAAMPEAE